MRQPKEPSKRKQRVLRKTKLVSAGSIGLLWGPVLKSIVRHHCSFPCKLNCIVITLLYVVLHLMHLIVTLNCG